MNPRIKNVFPEKNYILKIVFDNGEIKTFDVKPYLDKGIFRDLKNIEMFKSVKPYFKSIRWKNGQDFCPDTLYLKSHKLYED